MTRVVLGTLILVGMTTVAAPPASAGKPTPTPPPTPVYHLSDLALGTGKGAGLNSLSDDGLAAGVLQGNWTCKGSIRRRNAVVWDVNSHPTAPPPAWVDPVPSTCEYCFSDMAAMSSDGTWGAGEVCDPENGPSPDGCHCTEYIPMVWERDWSSQSMSFVRVELGDPIPNRPSIQAVTVAAGQRIAISFNGLWREVGGAWTQENYSGPGNRYSINSAGITVGNQWNGETYRASAWDCTLPGCSAVPVYLPGSPSTLQRYQINDFGDVVTYSSLHVWRYLGGMSWDDPEILPIAPFSSCYAVTASERLVTTGTLVVVGECNDSAGSHAARWRSTGPGQWIGPEIIEKMDDVNGQIFRSRDINPSGQILAQWGQNYHGCVETPLP